ncbi:MAG: protein-disulfide reductase DsbD [Campylobacterota bacterium]
MIRTLLLLIFSTSFLLSQDYLDPKDAFTLSFEKKQDSVTATVDLAEDIYLYADQVKVSVINAGEKSDITEQLNLRQPKEYDGFITYFDALTITIPQKLYSGSDGIDVSFQGCSTEGLCYPPMHETFMLKTAADAPSGPAQGNSIVESFQDKSAVLVLASFFGFGLLLSLTPCVFPMVPILSSLIVSHSSSGETMSAKKGFGLSLVYVLAMSIAYTIAGVLAGLFGANLQAALQNPVVLVVFAGIFVALAFSMFGYFKLELPQSLQNKINAKTQGAQSKGIKGVAIMGFLSALIVGPCVAPPLAGALVYIGQSGDALLGGAALFVMSLGMGMPLLAIGAGAGKFMPKPGGWMDKVSKIFGVVMLGLAIWMLERVLPSFFTMLLWAALFIGCALYLKAYKVGKPSLPKIAGVLLGLYGFALAIGAFNGAKDPLDPFSPFYQSQTKALQFNTVKSLDALKQKVDANDKVMIKYTADWCTVCDKFEATTLKDSAVQNALEDYTLLQVDVTDNSKEDKKLMQEYQIFGPPATVFFISGKQAGETVVGYKDSAQFLQILNSHP